MPPSWMIKLKEGWGEAKKDSEGEDDGLKKRGGGGGEEGKNPLPLCHAPPPLVPILYASKMAAF